MFWTYSKELDIEITSSVMPEFDGFALSLGKLCIDNGFEFRWPAHSQLPVLTRPDGLEIFMEVQNYVPLLTTSLSDTEYTVDYALPMTEGGASASTDGAPVATGTVADPSAKVEPPPAPHKGPRRRRRGKGPKDGDAGDGYPDSFVIEDLDDKGNVTERTEIQPSVEDRLKTEAQSIRHLMTHHPFNRQCPICVQANQKQQGNYRHKDIDPDDKPKKIGDCTTLDQWHAHDRKIKEEFKGNAVVIYDVGTKFGYCYPLKTMESCYIADALTHFRGRHKIKYVYSDASPALAKGVKTAGNHLTPH